MKMIRGGCKDCKWWAPEFNEETAEDHEYAYQNRNKNMRICLKSIRKVGEGGSLLFEAHDASNYYAHLETSPEWGCVEWEESEH